MKRTLGPNLAGTWYPADAEVLRADTRRMLDAVEPCGREGHGGPEVGSAATELGGRNQARLGYVQTDVG